MAEPPIHVEPEGVKAEPRKLGDRWLDLTIAGLALTLSVISLFVAIGNARTQERMVAAATWPMLQASFSDIDPETGQPVLRMQLTNTGVGPARVRSARLSFAGEPVPNSTALLAGSSGRSPAEVHRIMLAEPTGTMVTSFVSRRALRAGEEVDLLRMRRTASNAALFDALSRGRGRLELVTCYCSVFEECWLDTSPGPGPQRVRRCPEGSGPPYWS